MRVCVHVLVCVFALPLEMFVASRASLLRRTPAARGKVMDAVYNRPAEKLRYWDYSEERNKQGWGMWALYATFFVTFYIDNRHDTRNSGIATKIFGHASFF